MERRTSIHEFTEQEREDLLHMYRTHKAPAVADAFNTTQETVWRLASEAGQTKTKPRANTSLEIKLNRMKGRRYILNGLGWTVTVQGYEIEGKEVRVITDKAKPRVYPIKQANARLDEDFLKMAL